MKLPPPPPDIRTAPPAGPKQVDAARIATGQAVHALRNSSTFQQLPESTRTGILRDLDTIQRGLGNGAPARSLGTPMDFRRGMRPGQEVDDVGEPPADEQQASMPAGPRRQATETIAQRAGALSDEIDFPDFVASLVHGTFDAVVNASIRQMETFADLVSAVAKNVQDFTRDNVTVNQARDWLVQQYPADLYLDFTNGPKVLPRAAEGEDPEALRSPDWLADFQLAGEELTEELIEEVLLPKARERVGQSRQQMLATMVLLGMNRVIVRDGTISARLRFRAAAADHAKVEYAVSDDPTGGSSWGARGSSSYDMPSTKVSTVGVNVQSDAELKAELFGEVKINFVSETLPLDRFVDDARRTLLERHAKPSAAKPSAAAPAASAPVSATPPAAIPPATAAPVQQQPPPTPATPAMPPNIPLPGGRT